MPQIPKDPKTRQRRNKTSTARRLSGVPDDFPVPKLPAGRRWLKATRTWWDDVWASPMASEFVDGRVDVHGLFMLAVLVDDFWREPSASLAAEIRLQRQCFGLTPIDRRRLQWEIDRGEDASERTRRRRNAAVQTTGGGEAAPGQDPRNMLHVV